jgi:hypothetical protein
MYQCRRTNSRVSTNGTGEENEKRGFYDLKTYRANAFPVSQWLQNPFPVSRSLKTHSQSPLLGQICTQAGAAQI